MGKRELVLIALFLVAGVVVYQVTAPPSPAGSDVSIGGIFNRLKRGMRGARESASAQSGQTVAVPASAAVLRISLPRPCDLTITGTDGSDIVLALKRTARGFSVDEAKAAAEAIAIKIEPVDDAMVVTGLWDTNRRSAGDAFITDASVTLQIPRRLAVVIQPHIGLLNVTGVAKLEAIASRGETHVVGTAGDVVMTHNSGTLEITGGTGLKLSSRGSRGGISGISGVARIEGNGSKLKISEMSGLLDVDVRNSDIAIEKSPSLKPGVRFNGQGGELRIDGLRTEARIDGRNTYMTVALDAPAPVTIYNLGAITVIAPPGGYTIDAAATEGKITTDDSSITATPSDGPDARVSAKIRGGGPTLTLRATRGRIEVRKNAGSEGK